MTRVVVNIGANPTAPIENMLFALRQHVESTAMAFIRLSIDFKHTYQDTKCNKSLTVCKNNEEVYNPNKKEKTPASRSTHFG